MSDRKINNSKTKVFTLIIVTIITILILIGISVFWLKQNDYVKENLENENKISEENVIEEQFDRIKEYGIFGEYYEKAEQKLETLTIEEKIAQLFVIGNSANTDYTELQKYQFGGYLFFKEFFNEKTEKQVKNKIEQYQKASKIPLLMAVDEEGGIVVRISNNKNLSATPFKASSQIYNNGGFEAIKQDTINKSNFLNNLGINLNFAPVVDIANNPKDYMYSRSLQQDKDKTAIFAKTVIEASKGLGVSYTLKHFPGYGNNADTHIGSSIDKRTYEDIYNNDLEPFRAGIEAGAECVMVSHNIVTSIDDKNQASISSKVHTLLRDELNFKGIIITDALNMGAIRDENTIEDAIAKAITAGNDMIILSIDKNTTDKDGSKITYQRVINAVKNALNNKEIKQEIIDEAVTRILAWKYYKEMMLEI
ncbi:MAG: beta-hexosaminidase [Clostridia bacterium]|jgi:beta-N-acetylhexosaminidase|nr:beta-hexosaminidase [Clostridia bacterium]